MHPWRRLFWRRGQRLAQPIADEALAIRPWAALTASGADAAAELQSGGSQYSPRSLALKLDEVVAAVAAQLSDQSKLGIQITRLNDVPETGPTNKGVWNQIPNVTAVFADLKGSTGLSTEGTPRAAAFAYTYFIKAMTLILERFSARYIDIQGDGIFGLFSGDHSTFLAAASAITMRTQVEGEVATRFGKDTSVDWKLSAGIGIDRGTLLVRRLGVRGTKQNEVWAGKPVNIAAKLSSLADPNCVAVSKRVFAEYENASRLRRRALLWTCGCGGESEGLGLDTAIGITTQLWSESPAPDGLGLDFENFFKLGSEWCDTHGAEFCEAIITGKRPRTQ